MNFFYAVGKNLKNQHLKNSIFEEIHAGEHNIVKPSVVEEKFKDEPGLDKL